MGWDGPSPQQLSHISNSYLLFAEHTLQPASFAVPSNHSLPYGIAVGKMGSLCIWLQLKREKWCRRCQTISALSCQTSPFYIPYPLPSTAIGEPCYERLVVCGDRLPLVAVSGLGPGQHRSAPVLWDRNFPRSDILADCRRTDLYAHGKESAAAVPLTPSLACLCKCISYLLAGPPVLITADVHRLHTKLCQPVSQGQPLWLANLFLVVAGQLPLWCQPSPRRG